VDDHSGYYKYTDEFPSVSEIERWVAGYPDADQLISIISRSYDYIQKLPLKDLPENYTEKELSFPDSGT
jgi:hypothetical protein